MLNGAPEKMKGMCLLLAFGYIVVPAYILFCISFPREFQCFASSCLHTFAGVLFQIESVGCAWDSIVKLLCVTFNCTLRVENKSVKAVNRRLAHWTEYSTTHLSIMGVFPLDRV